MDAEFKKAKEKKEMLECQFTKRRQGRLWMSIKPKCSECGKRFDCLTMKANRYKLVENRASWIIYEIFAETKDEAMDVYYDYVDDGLIMREVKSDGDGGDIFIEEWNDNDNI